MYRVFQFSNVVMDNEDDNHDTTLGFEAFV